MESGSKFGYTIHNVDRSQGGSKAMLMEPQDTLSSSHSLQGQYAEFQSLAVHIYEKYQLSYPFIFGYILPSGSGDGGCTSSGARSLPLMPESLVSEAFNNKKKIGFGFIR